MDKKFIKKNEQLFDIIRNKKSLEGINLCDKDYCIIKALNLAYEFSYDNPNDNVKYIIQNSNYCLLEAILIAAMYKCEWTMNYIIDKIKEYSAPIPYLDICLGACWGGHLDLFMENYKFIEENDKKIWLDRMLFNSANSTNLELTNFLIKEGASIDKAIQIAKEGGRYEIVNYFNHFQANNLTR